MDVSSGLFLHAEIKQETDIDFTSDVSVLEPRPLIEFTNINNNNTIDMGVNNYINNENHEEMVDNKETTLKTIQMLHEDFVDDTNEVVHVPTNQIPQTSRANSTKVKRFLPGQCPSQWPQAATYLLIELYKKHKNLFESPIINKKDSWKRISSILASNGYPYTASVCDNKFRALKYRYNLLKESNGKSTMGRRRWEFFRPMEQLMADCPLSTESVSLLSGNYRKTTPSIKKPSSQFYQKIVNVKNRKPNILALRSSTTTANQTFPSRRNIKTPTMIPYEKLMTPNSSSLMSERNQDAPRVLPQTTYLPKNGTIPSTVSKTSEQQSSQNISNEKSCRSSVEVPVENPTSNGPPSWFVKFQEDSLKRLSQIEQLEHRKTTAYERRNILIDQRTKVLTDISRSLERVADSVDKNSNGSSTTRKDLLMMFSEFLKSIEDT